MDFRSQLSALSGKNGGGGGRVPNRSNNSGSSNNYYGRGGGGGNSNYGNQRNHQDRRRPRGAWNNQQGGPPSSRRRYHSPDRDGLGELRNLGYRIPHRGGVGGEIDSSRKEKPNKKTKHLALLGKLIAFRYPRQVRSSNKSFSHHNWRSSIWTYLEGIL